MSKLKIYVASPFAQIDRVKQVHKLIEQAGMEWTSRWAEEPITGLSSEIAEKAFQMDRADLARSNVLLALIDIPGGRETFAEIEVARLTGIPIVFVGKPHMSLEREYYRDKNSLSENFIPKYWDANSIEGAITILQKFVKPEIPVPYYEFANEREKQDKKWGQQNWPSIFPSQELRDYYRIPSEDESKIYCQMRAKDGTVSWTDIALEEFCEAVYAKDDVDRRRELVQLGAVITAWIECIDRKKSNCQRCGGIGELDDRGFQLVGQPYFMRITCDCMK